MHAPIRPDDPKLGMELRTAFRGRAQLLRHSAPVIGVNQCLPLLPRRHKLRWRKAIQNRVRLCASGGRLVNPPIPDAPPRNVLHQAEPVFTLAFHSISLSAEIREGLASQAKKAFTASSKECIGFA